MSRTVLTLDHADAQRMIRAAQAEADAIGLAYCVAVVDAGGDLIALARQDGALIGCIDLAINKARTARLFDKRTDDLGHMAQPGGRTVQHRAEQSRQCHPDRRWPAR